MTKCDHYAKCTAKIQFYAPNNIEERLIGWSTAAIFVQ